MKSSIWSKESIWDYLPITYEFAWLYLTPWVLWGRWKTRDEINRMKKAGKDFVENSSVPQSEYAFKEIGEILALSEFQSIYGFPEYGIFENPSEHRGARLIKLLISSNSLLFFDASDFEKTKVVTPLADVISVQIQGVGGRRLYIETEQLKVIFVKSKYYMAIPVRRFLIQLGCCHKVEY
jgi:hypothetical protein